MNKNTNTRTQMIIHLKCTKARFRIADSHFTKIMLVILANVFLSSHSKGQQGLDSYTPTSAIAAFLARQKNCCSDSSSYNTGFRTLYFEEKCSEKKKVYSYKNGKGEKVKVVLYKPEYKKLRGLNFFSSLNVGLLYSDRALSSIDSNNRLYCHGDLTFGGYVSSFTVGKSIFPIGVRGGFGVVLTEKASLTAKGEFSTGYYIRKSGSFAGINIGVMVLGNFNANVTSYISFGFSQLLFNGKHFSRSSQES